MILSNPQNNNGFMHYSPKKKEREIHDIVRNKRTIYFIITLMTQVPINHIQSYFIPYYLSFLVLLCTYYIVPTFTFVYIYDLHIKENM